MLTARYALRTREIQTTAVAAPGYHAIMVTMHAGEAHIDAELVRCLLRGQFPH